MYPLFVTRNMSGMATVSICQAAGNTYHVPQNGYRGPPRYALVARFYECVSTSVCLTAHLVNTRYQRVSTHSLLSPLTTNYPPPVIINSG